jgi:hypothetical protein
MQDTKRFGRPASGGGSGVAGALCSLLKVGERTGVNEGVFDAMREWTGKGWVKQNAVK